LIVQYSLIAVEPYFNTIGMHLINLTATRFPQP